MFLLISGLIPLCKGSRALQHRSLSPPPAQCCHPKRAGSPTRAAFACVAVGSPQPLSRQVSPACAASAVALAAGEPACAASARGGVTGGWQVGPQHTPALCFCKTIPNCASCHSEAERPKFLARKSCLFDFRSGRAAEESLLNFAGVAEMPQNKRTGFRRPFVSQT